MNTNINLEDLNIEFKEYLNTISYNISNDLKNLLESESLFTYNKGKNFNDIVAFYFEYQYDLLDITFYAIDAKSELICNSISLPTQKEDLKWLHLIPEKIYRKFQKIEQKINREKIVRYQQEKENILHKWFQECWDSATSERRARIDSYFSIHDTYFKTDLNTGEELNDEQIQNRYK